MIISGNQFKIFSTTFLILTATIVSCVNVNAEVIERNKQSFSSNNGSTRIRVETEGEGQSSVNVSSTSNTSSQTKIVQNGYKEEIKVESKNGETKSEVIINGKKVYVGNEGKIEVKSESVKADPTSTPKLEPTIKIEKTEGGVSIIVTKSGVAAESSISATVSPGANSISVKTSNGELKILSPDQVINIISKEKRLDEIKDDMNSKLKEKLKNVKKLIKLSDQKGYAVYEVQGTKNYSLFGFFNFKLNKKLIISASTGQILQDNLTI